MDNIEIEIFAEICREGAKLPKYARTGDAGMDIFAAEEVIIKPGDTVVIRTGLKIAIPEGYEVQIRPRSGISFNTPLRIANSPGTIDSGYRDELGILINNTSHIDRAANINSDIIKNNKLLSIGDKGNQTGTYIIRKGDRVAQMVLQKVPKAKFTVISSIEKVGKDRGGGFGSTGV